MKKRKLHLKSWLALSTLATFFWLGTPARAQSVPAQDNRPIQDNDTTRQELARFDEFLNSHPEVAGQLRKDPSLINNEQFMKDHPALRTYLQDHPAIREQIKRDPDTFMREADRFDRRADGRDRDISREELAHFDQFLDSHREIAEQVRKDPSLVNNGEFVKNHPALQTYLQDHPAIREQLKENPNAFMHIEDRFDRREDNRGRDINHEELANFDRFLESHRETAEQLRKDPSLVDNGEFVKNHPALQTYLQDHPGVREELKQDPNAFMQEEARYYHPNETDRDMDRDDVHRHFGEFLGGHPEISRQLAKDPSLVSKQEYLENHPELREYLNGHPEVRQELMANPQAFVKSSQQFNINAGQTVKTPTANPKPNQ
jgi:hypothetical protein